MKFLIFLLILIILSSINLFPQSKTRIDEIRKSYESFRFEDVIKECKYELRYDSALTNDNKIEFLTMQAVSYYSLSDFDSSKISFIELLKIERDHELDPVIISPKILDFFESIKKDFKHILPEEEIDNAERDSVRPVNYISFDSAKFSNSIIRSIILPGTGHLYAGSVTKGWILTIGSTLNAAGMIYYIIKTNDLERKYLTATEASDINYKYREYNTAYKIRNVLIGSYAVVWILSQLDMLFNSDNLFVIPASLAKNRFTPPDVGFSLILNF